MLEPRFKVISRDIVLTRRDEKTDVEPTMHKHPVLNWEFLLQTDLCDICSMD